MGAKFEFNAHSFFKTSVSSTLTLSNVLVSASAYKTLTSTGGTFRVGPSSKLQRVEGRGGKGEEERGGEGREGEGCGLTDDVEFSYSSTVVTYENSVWYQGIMTCDTSFITYLENVKSVDRF